MKRIFAAVLALCLCAAGAAMAQESEDGWAAGDTVVFGSYEQDNVLTNGKEPLEWIVLKTEGDRAMLITRYLIDARAYHKAFVKMTWSECTLRQWLNDTFLKEAFSQGFEWLKGLGGVNAIYEQNKYKAGLLYDFLDQSALFKAPARRDCRSLMNVTFVTGDADKDAAFVKYAAKNGLVNLKGHRSVGGMRASIYNAMPVEGVKKLVEVMKAFEKENA